MIIKINNNNSLEYSDKLEYDKSNVGNEYWTFRIDLTRSLTPVRITKHIDKNSKKDKENYLCGNYFKSVFDVEIFYVRWIDKDVYYKIQKSAKSDSLEVVECVNTNSEENMVDYNNYNYYKYLGEARFISNILEMWGNSRVRGEEN